jgi:hypothetical protein
MRPLQGRAVTSQPPLILVPVPQTSVPSSRCRACHRELTDPVSRAIGLGPDCLARLRPSPPCRASGDRPPGPDDPVLPLDGDSGGDRIPRPQ